MIARTLLMRRLASLAGAFLLAIIPSTFGKVVDNFDDNIKTGWTDAGFGIGSATETGGQLKFSIPAVQDIFFASSKNTEDYTLADGKTIELRVDMISANRPDAYAVLAWIPNAVDVKTLAGYSLTKAPAAILISKGINKYFVQEATPDLKQTNVTMVLSLTGQGTNVVINVKVLDKDDGNRVIYERTVIDTPAADALASGSDSPAAPYTGPGKMTLMLYEDFNSGGPSTYEVVYDNAESFVYENALIDDFNSTKTGWTDAGFGIGSSTVANGVISFSLPPVQDIFFSSLKNTRSYEFKDGEKLEFRADLISGSRPDAYAILSWTPDSVDPKSLQGYGLVKSSAAILVSKGVNKYFLQEAHPEIKNNNVTLALNLERRGTSVIINTRIYDKDNNNAVLFDRTFIDTDAADALAAGADSPAAAYTGPGKFALMDYEDFNAGTGNYDVVFDNAFVMSPPLPANLPPTITDITPASGKNFLPTTTTVGFKVSDDNPLPSSGIAVTLNGVRYTTANGLSLTASGNTTTGSLGGLVANKTYTAVIEATDAGNALTSTTIYFDTFATNNFLIEMEDYNFSAGLFIDNPTVEPVGGGSETSYRGQIGFAETDYHNNRGNYAAPYRPDRVTQNPTLDYAREPYISLGGAAAGYIDYDTGRVNAGEWQRYTRTFAAGTYEVYLRETFLNTPTGESVLEKVDGDPSDPSAPVELLGSFIGVNSGTLYRNIPLTDALGQTKATVTFDGVTTLRVRHITSEPGDGDIYQNYMLFVPTAPVTNRPRIASLSPAARSTVYSPEVKISATLEDRDTTVNTNTLELYINNVKASAVIASPGTGTNTINYTISPIPASGATVNASIRFTDSASVRVTNDWSFTVQYTSLDPANRVAAAQTPGFNTRTVQVAPGAPRIDSVVRAEDQLGTNPQTPNILDYSTNVLVINLNQTDGANDGYFPADQQVPGLDQPDAIGNDDFAVEATAYLDLPAGIVRFGVRSDDGFKLSSGSGLSSQTPVLDTNSGTSDQTVDVLVPTAGLYPVRLVYYERGGGAFVELYTQNRTTGERILAGSDAAGAIKAYQQSVTVAQTVTLYSSTDVAGTFTPDATGLIDTTTKTITASMNASPRYYLVRATGVPSVKITSVAAQGLNIVMTYGAP